MHPILHILLLILYSFLAVYGIRKLPFLRNSGIRPAWLLLLFGLHVFAGWIHNWIAWRYFPEHGDVWNYYRLSFLYRHRLFSQFPLFLADNSTWTYISHNGIIYIQLLLDWLSFDSMNLNTLLFAFPVFLGNVALFRVFRRRFPNDLLTAGSVFWLPSALFWTACIYREGVLYMLLGFLFYYLERRRVLICIGCFLLIAYFRSAIAILLLPALLVWWLIEHPLPRRRLWVLTVGIAAGLLFFSFFSRAVPGFYTPILRAAAAEQASFQQLEGHSRLALPILDSSFGSLWRVFPAAVRNGLFEPLPGSGGSPIYLVFSLELVLIWCVVLLAIITTLSRKPAPAASVSSGTALSTASGSPPLSGFAVCCLLFALSGMLLIGIMVPFAGTIVRYRSIYLPFLLAPCLHTVRSFPPFQKLNHWLVNKLRILI